MRTLPARLSVFLLVSFLAFNVARADIAYDNVSSNSSGSAGTTLNWSHSVGSGDDRVLVVGIAGEDTSSGDLTISSVKYGSAGLTLVPGSTATAGTGTLQRTELYYLLAPTVGTDTVEVTYVGNVSNRVAGAISLTGVTQQAPEAVETNWHTNLDSITTRISTLSDGAWLVDVVACGDSGHFTTIAGDMTKRWEKGVDGSYVSSGAGSTKPVGTARLTTTSWQHGLFSPSRLVYSVAAFAPAPYQPTPGTSDINGDGAVDYRDLMILAQQWLYSQCSGQYCPELDGVGGIDFGDFAILTGDWTGIVKAQTGLVINEFMASNGGIIADDQGEFDDWIELYNGTGSPMDIGGMYVTDDLNNPDKYQIPTDVSGQTTIPAYSYLLLWADGETEQGPLHLSFNLSKGGEDVGLFESDLTMIDGKSYSQQYADVSYGRYPNATGAWLYMGQPTPQADNNDGYGGVVEDVDISHVRGFYDSSIDVELFCEDDEADIYYTLDGNTPFADYNNPSLNVGTLYSGTPITVTTTTALRAAAFRAGWKGGIVNTATYIFLDDVKAQSNAGAYARGFPSVWEDKNGGTDGLADYEMDNDDVLNDPGYSAAFEGAMKQIPTVSLVTDVCNLFDPQTGIYSNPMSRHNPDVGEDWERPVSVEYFDPCTGGDFQINAGLRLVGNQSREPWLNSKHSLRIFFKGEYGPSELEFPLYQNTGADRLNNLSLRANYHWSWLNEGSAERGQYLRDTFAQDTLRDMGYLSPDSRHVHLYINGLYWGIYQASERPDDAFLAEHLGGERDEYDVIEGVIINRMDDGDALGGVELKAGEWDTWDYMWSLFDGSDFSRPMSGSDYEQLQDYLDTAAFCDYIIYNAFVENWDWCAKNWYAACLRDPAAINGPPTGKWVFYTWDAEISIFQHGFHKTVPFQTYYSWGPGNMHNCLHGVGEYNRLLGDRIHKLLFNNGVLIEQRNIDRYEARAEQIEEAILGESARWGDFIHDFIDDVNYGTFTPVDWDYELDRLTNPARIWDWWGPYFPQRTEDAINKFQGDGSYPPDSRPAPSFSQQGGEISGGSSVTITGSGTIYYTTDGSEPMDYGSTISSGSSVTINHSLTLKARSYYGGTDWSALTEATFAVGSIVDDLRITEIMYHPPSIEGVDYNDPNHEFIELKNIGTGSLNLNLVKFTEAIDYTFGNMTLAAGDHVLVVKNQSAFEAKYGGGKNIAGEWTGPRGGILSNAGERVRLEDAIDRVILDFSYGDGWRKNTDGEGFSLNFLDADANSEPNRWLDKANWAASKYKGGTPDADDGALLAEHSIVINEVLAHQDTAPGDWIELKNTTGGSIDIGGWYVSDDDANLLKYRIKSGTSLNAGGYLVLTEDANFGPNSVDPGKDVNFALSEYGETVYLTSAEGSQLTGYREQEDFDSSENGVAFGRHQKSTGTYNFVAMSSNTEGSANASPKVGPIVITEIMYNPASGGQNEEYVELYNTTSSTVYLYENVDDSNVPWKFTDGIKYTFDTDANIPGYGRMLVVKTSPSYFKTLYSVPGGVQVVGPYYGFLSNSGEKLELGKPGDKDEQGVQHYVRVDRVAYSDGFHPDNPWESDPWPSSPDAGGKSLERISTSTYGNDVANWHDDNPSPGS